MDRGSPRDGILYRAELCGSCSPVAFDEENERIYVCDLVASRVQVFDSHDGSLIGVVTGLESPTDVNVDNRAGVIVVVDHYGQRLNRVRAEANLDFSTEPHEDEIKEPTDESRRCMLAKAGSFDETTHCLEVTSDPSNLLHSLQLRVVGTQFPDFVHTFDCRNLYRFAINVQRRLVYAADRAHHRVDVISLVDGSLLFTIGRKGSCEGEFRQPTGICIVNHERVIVADAMNRRLQAFTYDGRFISSYKVSLGVPTHVAFAERRGLIGFVSGGPESRLCVIEPNHWLPDTYEWSADNHRFAPKDMRRAIFAFVMMRTYATHSAVCLLPNELLFEIFKWF